MDCGFMPNPSHERGDDAAYDDTPADNVVTAQNQNLPKSTKVNKKLFY